MIEKMIGKYTCLDLFREVKIDNVPLFDSKNMSQLVRYKLKYNHLMDVYLKLRLVLGFKAITGKMYIQLIIKLIDISK